MIAAATFTELLELEAVQRSFAAVVLASLGLPIAGVLIVGLDVITARFAVMHLALLGTAAGLFLGIDPVLSALAVSCIATGALTPLATRPGGLSGSMGLLMTMAIGSALLLLSMWLACVATTVRPASLSTSGRLRTIGVVLVMV